MAKKAGLGRGLESLLGEVRRDVAAPIESGEAADTMAQMPKGITLISVGAIRPHPDQPRRYFAEDALNELADSIAQRGIIQPIVVRRWEQGYQIIAGERRWRAAQRARLHEIPAIVRDFTDSEALEIALIENIQRQDLTAIEEAEAYHRLMEEFGHTQSVLAKLVDKSRSHVANLLRLLELPAPVREMVSDGRLTMGHARALVVLDDPLPIAEDAVRDGWTVRQIEDRARAIKTPDSPNPKSRNTKSNGSRATKSADYIALEQSLSDILGVNIAINPGPTELEGELVLTFKNLDQLDMLLQRLSGEAI